MYFGTTWGYIASSWSFLINCSANEHMDDEQQRAREVGVGCTCRAWYPCCVCVVGVGRVGEREWGRNVWIDNGTLPSLPTQQPQEETWPHSSSPRSQHAPTCVGGGLGVEGGKWGK